MEIELAAETIGNIGPLPITNTLLVSWATILLLFFLSFFATRKITKIPEGMQNVFEFIVDAMYNLIEELAHSKVKTFFPIVMTFFLFIMTANWLGLLPGFGTIGFWENKHGEEIFVPLLRSINADLNMTLALAIISVVATHYFSIKFLGFRSYIGHWLSLNPVFLFVGMIEVVGEFTKMVSLSFRLFGNIFAGEVVLATVAGIFAFLAPLPFYFLEIIVGVVQAAVFMMLTAVFMVLLTDKHAEEH